MNTTSCPTRGEKQENGKSEKKDNSAKRMSSLGVSTKGMINMKLHALTPQEERQSLELLNLTDEDAIKFTPSKLSSNVLSSKLIQAAKEDAKAESIKKKLFIRELEHSQTN
jgi:hypothetical protein